MDSLSVQKLLIWSIEKKKPHPTHLSEPALYIPFRTPSPQQNQNLLGVQVQQLNQSLAEVQKMLQMSYAQEKASAPESLFAPGEIRKVRLQLQKFSSDQWNWCARH